MWQDDAKILNKLIKEGLSLASDIRKTEHFIQSVSNMPMYGNDKYKAEQLVLLKEQVVSMKTTLSLIEKRADILLHELFRRVK